MKVTSLRPRIVELLIGLLIAGLPTSAFSQTGSETLLEKARERQLTSQEFVALGFAYAEDGHLAAATLAGNLAEGTAVDSTEKAAALVFQALLLGSQQDYSAAAAKVELAQTLLPDNAGIASLRMSYHELAGNGVEALAAKSHLMRLDPEFARNPVFDPGTALIFVKLVAIVAAAVLNAWSSLPRQDKQKVRDMFSKSFGNNHVATR